MFTRIVERFSHSLMLQYVDFFIFVFLNSYSRLSKLPQFITNGIRALELKIFGRTKDYEIHKMRIKGISVQGRLDLSLIKM